MVVEIDAPQVSEGQVRQVGIPLRLSETPGAVRFLGAVTGLHTAETLAALGYTANQIAGLHRRGVVQQSG